MGKELKTNLSLFDLVYSVLLLILSPAILLRFFTQSQFRLNFLKRLIPVFRDTPAIESPEGKRIWIHAASVGEVKIAQKLIQLWKTQDPLLEFVVTVNTLSAFDITFEENGPSTYVAPLDFTILVKRFIKHTAVNHLLLIETEIWPNMIRLMSQRGKVVIVNGRLSDRFFSRYLKSRFLLKRTLSKISFVLTRDDIASSRFKQLGVEDHKISCAGNLKYELPDEPSLEQQGALKKSYLINQAHFLFIAGSVQPEEVSSLIEVWRQLKDDIPQFRMIVVPRHPDKRQKFERELNSHEVPYLLATRDQLRIEDLKKNPINVIDEIGILRAWYELSNVVFVGGSLCKRTGGQNMVEAVGLKKPVCIGPHTPNFKEEVCLLQRVDGIRLVKDSVELVNFIKWCYSNPDKAMEYGERGYQAIRNQTNALPKIVAKLTELFGHVEES